MDTNARGLRTKIELIMVGFSTDDDRKVIPRWRTFRQALRTEELNSVLPPQTEQRVTEDPLATKITDWRSNQTIGHAADLVGAAIVLGRPSDVGDAAQFLLSAKAPVSAWAKELAECVSIGPKDIEQNFQPAVDELEEQALHRQVHTFRCQLHARPRDPITWAELSRSYAILGQEKLADRSMNAALQLANNNRFILRAASRFWVHRNDPERAHQVVAKADRTKHDPWLLAAEIAVGSINKGTPRYVKEARRMLARGQFSPHHVSELASALATLELHSGKVKKSRNLFRQSLEQPTENSVAQAGWALRQRTLEFEMHHPSVPNTFEAESWKSFENSQWKQTVEQCKLWHFDQPFSSRPAIMGSYVSAVALADYETSVWFAENGIRSNPSDFLVMNNLAFSLINRGTDADIENAKKQLAKAGRLHLSGGDRVVLQATLGFLAFRTKHAERGRELYANARRRAQSMNDNRLYALASAFHAIEELSQGGPISDSIKSDALQALKRVPDDPILNFLQGKLARMGP